MTTEITSASPQKLPAISQEQAARGTERLKHLLPLLRECQEARTEADRILPAISAPARPEWVIARALSLLSPYFEKEVPQAIREMEAEDWAVALADAPQWAVDAAVRWWKSADNPKRARRPMEGDIQERVRFEMRAIRAAKIAMAAPLAEKLDSEERTPITPERMQEIMEEEDMTRARLSRVAPRAMPGADFAASEAARASGRAGE